MCFCVSVLQVKVLLGHRVIQVACGSRDAQTLALTDEGISVPTSCLFWPNRQLNILGLRLCNVSQKYICSDLNRDHALSLATKKILE